MVHILQMKSKSISDSWNALYWSIDIEDEHCTWVHLLQLSQETALLRLVTFLSQIVHGYLVLRSDLDTFPLYTWAALFPMNRRSSGASIDVIEFTRTGKNVWFKSGTDL